LADESGSICTPCSESFVLVDCYALDLALVDQSSIAVGVARGIN
jgi:hypothetical protein